MPQLDIVYIFTTYIWTWLMLCLLVRKTKTLMFTKVPKTPPHMTNKKLTQILPWT